MKELKENESLDEDGYEKLEEYFNEYVDFANVVIDGNGSLNSYNEDFTNLDESTANLYDKFKLYMEN